MDPITQAIIIEVGKKSIDSAYEGIKNLLIKKFGSESKVVRAAEDVKDNPSSDEYKAVLGEEIKKVRADKDRDLLQEIERIRNQTAGRDIARARNIAEGKGNITEGDIIKGGHDVKFVKGEGGGNAAVGDINIGRSGPIVTLVLVSLIVLAVVFLQIFPHLQTVIVANVTPTPAPTPTLAPTPTPTVAAVPTNTLQLFCAYVKTNFSDQVYNTLYTDRLRQQVSPQQFQDEWEGQPYKNNIESCTPSSIFTYSSNTKAQGSLVLQKRDGPFTQINQLTYSVTLVKVNNYWYIDNLQQI